MINLLNHAKKNINKINGLRKIACFFLLIMIFSAQGSQNVINVYSWSGYLPNEVLQKFTKETGIKINLSEYDSNETMYAKLKTVPHAGYDLIIPSSYFVSRMINQNMLLKLDKDKLPNLKNINPLFLHREFDPNNDYSIPHLWGTNGIVINSKYIKEKDVTSWQDLWNPKYKNELLILSDPRDVFAMALLILGYSINDTDSKHLHQAYEKLQKLLPNIKIFNSDAEQTIYIDEDAIIGMGWNGDVYVSQQENPNLKYIYPREGFVLWIDSLVITKYAPHLENTYKFINFLLRPEIAKIVSETTAYSTPNLEALKLLPAKMHNNPVINPDAETLKRGKLQVDITPVLPLYEKYWELLKMGG